MKTMHIFDAYLARCLEHRRVLAILLLPLVFAGCASQGIKGAYLDAVEVGTAFPTTVSGVTQSNLPIYTCLLYTSPSPRDGLLSRMPSSA